MQRCKVHFMCVRLCNRSVLTEKQLLLFNLSNTNFKLSLFTGITRCPRAYTLPKPLLPIPSTVKTVHTQTTLRSPTLKANLRLMLSDVWRGPILKLSRGRLPKTPSSFSSGTNNTKTFLRMTKNKQIERTTFKTIRNTSLQPRFYKCDL